jgi:hypothetical protein
VFLAFLKVLKSQILANRHQHIWHTTDLFINDGKMNLIFSSFEAFAVLIAVQGIRNLVSDGESNWIEGVMLVAIYVLLGGGVYSLCMSPDKFKRFGRLRPDSVTRISAGGYFRG